MSQIHNSTEPQFSLTPAMFQVLLALGDEEKHGYAILKDVEEQTDGHVRLSTGTLYAMIKRLLVEGILKECRNRPPADEDDPRRRARSICCGGSGPPSRRRISWRQAKNHSLTGCIARCCACFRLIYEPNS